jgi:predicted transcriptional regulator
MCYFACAMNKRLTDILHRADDWPEAAQDELAKIADEIETELTTGAYRATPEELAGIDRGLRDSANGKFATDEEAEAVFAKHRRS